MRDKLRELGQRAADGLNSGDESTRRRWQKIIGTSFMAVFVVAAFAVTQTVQALNQAAGNYGYYGGSYGYQSAVATSDDLPSAPTSLTTSSIGASSATVGWTAPTTTVLSTSLDNLSTYLFHYHTSSLSSCSGGTSSTTTSTSTALTGLSANTTYYVAVCARDTNSNDSSALTGSFTTSASAGSSGGGGGGGAGGSVFGGTTTPAGTTGTPAAPAGPPVASPATGSTDVGTVSAPTTGNLGAILAALGTTSTPAAQEQASTLLSRALGGGTFSGLSAAVQSTVRNFVAVGHTIEAGRIGAGERASLIENFTRVFGEVPQSDNDFRAVQGMILCANGRPCADLKLFRRSRVAESDFLAEFRRLNGRFPCEGFTRGTPACAEDWQSLEILTYGYKPLTRNLVNERTAIRSFRAIEYIEDFQGVRTVKPRGANPSAIGHWNAIRSAVYGNWAHSGLNPNRSR